MNTDHEIPHEFKAAIFPNYVRIATANAIISAQYTERVLNAICLVLKTDGLQFSAEDFLSNDSSRTRQTLGMIEKQIRKTNLFEPSFSERLLHFTQRRNRIVHGLFADSFKSRDQINIDSKLAHEYVQECEWVSSEAANLVEIGFGIYRVLGDILLASNPGNDQLNKLLSGFDEFYKVGLSSMVHQFVSR